MSLFPSRDTSVLLCVFSQQTSIFILPCEAVLSRSHPVCAAFNSALDGGILEEESRLLLPPGDYALRHLEDKNSRFLSILCVFWQYTISQNGNRFAVIYSHRSLKLQSLKFEVCFVRVGLIASCQSKIFLVCSLNCLIPPVFDIFNGLNTRGYKLRPRTV